MVLACESIPSRKSLDPRPQNLHTFTKVSPKYIQCTCPMGQVRYSVRLPVSYNLQILLARGNRASTNVEPCWDLNVGCDAKQRAVSSNSHNILDHSTFRTGPLSSIYSRRKLTLSQSFHPLHCGFQDIFISPVRVSIFKPCAASG